MSPRRRDAALLGLALLALVSGLVARPVARAVDPELAVEVTVWSAHRGALLDPWGRPFADRWQVLPTSSGGTVSRLVTYSVGSNGIDDRGAGDDIEVPLLFVDSATRDLLAEAHLLGPWLGLVLAWVAATFHAGTRRRRLAAAVAMIPLLGAAVFVSAGLSLGRRLPIDERHLLVSPGCALFLSLGFAGTLWLAWASRRPQDADASA